MARPRPRFTGGCGSISAAIRRRKLLLDYAGRAAAGGGCFGQQDQGDERPGGEDAGWNGAVACRDHEDAGRGYCGAADGGARHRAVDGGDAADLSDGAAGCAAGDGLRRAQGIRADISDVCRRSRPVEAADLPKPDVLFKRGRKWAPFRSVASWYLWRACDLAKDKGIGMGGDRAEYGEAEAKASDEKAAKSSKSGQRPVSSVKATGPRTYMKLFAAEPSDCDQLAQAAFVRSG